MSVADVDMSDQISTSLDCTQDPPYIVSKYCWQVSLARCPKHTTLGKRWSQNVAVLENGATTL